MGQYLRTAQAKNLRGSWVFASNVQDKPTQPKQPDIKDIALGTSVGIVLHDNSNAMTEGWAFKPGVMPFRVRGIYELPNDTLWISSGEFKEFRRNNGDSQHNLRRNGFIGVRLSELAKDIGIRIDGGFAEEGGQILVPFVEEIVRKCIVLYHLDQPARQLQEDSLIRAVTKALPPSPPLKNYMTAALAGAYQSYSLQMLPFQDNSRTVTLRFSRMHYAQWLLSQKVPDSAWTVFTNVNLFNHEDVMAGNAKPMLIKGVVEFENCDAQIAALIAYGVSMNARTKNQRLWMTDVEYRWLSQFARIHVMEYMCSHSAVAIPESYQLPHLINDDKLLAHPISEGVISQIHWQSLAAAKYLRVTNTSEYDPLATWLRAYDRAKCFEAAHLLHSKGFSVLGYGNGSLTVRLTSERLDELIEVGLSFGIAHPSRASLYLEFGYANPE